MCGSVCLGLQRRILTVIAAGWCMRVLVCVFLCTRRMLAVIAAGDACVCLFVCSCAQGACSLWLLRGYACVCGSECLGLHKADAHGDCCEAMHACVGVRVWACTRRMVAARQCMYVWKCVYGAHGHSDRCETKHVFVGVRVWAWARRMLTVVFAAR